MYASHVSANRACVNDDECTVIEGAGTCDCAPAIGAGQGDALRRDAAGRAAALARYYWDCVESGEIETVSAVCDAAPGEPACRDGACVAINGNCFPGPDAGGDAGDPPDAG